MITLLPHTILNNAQNEPDQEAFRYKDRSITYGELVLESNRLAHSLLDHGLRKGDRVGIYLDRCLETVIAIYGVMQAGGVYVPLDPSAPHAYTEIVIRDCDIEIVITQQSKAENLTKLIQKVSLNLIIGVDSKLPVATVSWEQLAHYQSTDLNLDQSEHDLAYIMFTSGSTGIPKGIMHTHKSGLSYARLSANLYGLNSQDRLGSHAPLHFDISTLAYFTGPFVGASSVVIPEAHTRLPASLTQLIQNEKITVWYSAPLALVQMLSHGVLEDRELNCLRWILFGGEPFPPKYLRKLMLLIPGAS